jgi:lipoprotein-anchoring transpeptidase ErfK/SrfK
MKPAVACAVALIGCAVFSCDDAYARHAHAHAAKATPAAWTAEQVNDAATMDEVRPGLHGAATLRAQILLDRAHFSPGEIDAGFGTNLRRAIAGYQAANGLDANGTVDAATWKSLDADGAPALTQYTLTDADVAGPFVIVPSDMMEKSKLPALGYSSVLEEIGERFHASPQLLQRLNPQAAFSQAGEILVVPSVAASAPLANAAKVVVARGDSTVSIVDASGRKLAQFPASTGSDHDPLPIGEWKIKGILRDPVFHYDPSLFWDADAKQAKATIPAGPNNPVGVVWLDLSKPHYGIHGTPEPSKIGKTQSHGCIRLTNWDALTLAQSVTAGMTAVLQE